MNSKWYIKKWGIGFGKFSITWWDLWDKKFVFEVVWGGKILFKKNN